MDFYSVAAQVIPTVLIAIALEGGFQGRGLVGEISLGITGVMAMAGEYVSLRVLIGDYAPRKGLGTIVYFGILFPFLLAVQPLLVPERFRKKF